MRYFRRVAIPLILVVAACSGSSSKGATAQLSFAGDAGLAGAATKPVVSCNFPKGIDGSTEIRVSAQASDPAVRFSVTVTAANVSVVVSSGSGTAVHVRDFEGTGVRGFNAAKGAQINAALTDTTAAHPGANPGKLAAITTIKGSVACGNQTVGASSVTFSGVTAEGALSGGADSFRVQCDTSSQGNSVNVGGVVKVGSTKAFFAINVAADSIDLLQEIPGPPAIHHHYLVKAAGVATLSANGAHLRGDVVEQSATTGKSTTTVPAYTVHLEGDLTCGVTVSG